MNRKSAFLPSLTALLLVLAVSFGVRGITFFLPAAVPGERPYLQDEKGSPYLTEMDSYFFLRKAAEMAEKEQIILYNNRQEDPLIGQRTYDQRDEGKTPLGLSVLAYILWRYFLSFFGVSLTQTAVWMGPFFASLAAIPAFLYVRRRSCLTGGITAGLLTGCALPFVVHTHAGFFDTDMVLALLPLLFLLCQMRCMQEKRFLKQTAYALISAAALAAISFFWTAFNAYWLLSVICILFTILLTILLPSGLPAENPPHRKWHVIRGGLTVLILMPVLLYLTGGVHTLRQLLSVLDLMRSAAGSTAASMPNAYRFTGEMRRLRKLPGRSPWQLVQVNTGSVMGFLGGAIPCILAAAALLIAAGVLVYRLTRRKSAGNPAETDSGIVEKGSSGASGITGSGTDLCVEIGFLLPWLLLSLKLAFSSMRYCEIAVLPVCLLCGLAVGWIASAAGRGRKSRLRALLRMTGPVLAVIAILPACAGALQTARSILPAVTDSKYQAMQYIREELPADTAVAGWWDDGYFTEYAAGRRALADGGSSSGVMNWLLAKALLTDDPRLSCNIFHMLNENGTDAFRSIVSLGIPEADAANLLMELLSSDRAEAGEMLQGRGLDRSLLEKTHPAASNAVVLTLSTDLIEYSRAMHYYASWNPETGSAGQSSGILASDGSVIPDDNHNADLAMCRSNVILHISENEDGQIAASYIGSDGQQYAAGRICVWQDGIKIQDNTPNPDPRPAGVVLVKEGNRYCGVICSQDLCDCILLRLLLCEDRGLEAFRLAGTWYGDSEHEPSAAERRIRFPKISSRASQVWEIRLAEKTGPGRVLHQ